ncbi:MAG: DUF4834 family protein [Sphingobacteriaceae bacterium]
MGLIKFILYFFLILWTLRILFRLLLPVVFRQLIKKVQNQAQQTQAKPQYKEGTIHVDHVPPKGKKTKNTDQAGEFVDFEEIK